MPLNLHLKRNYEQTVFEGLFACLLFKKHRIIILPLVLYGSENLEQ